MLISTCSQDSATDLQEFLSTNRIVVLSQRDIAAPQRLYGVVDALAGFPPQYVAEQLAVEPDARTKLPVAGFRHDDGGVAFKPSYRIGF